MWKHAYHGFPDSLVSDLDRYLEFQGHQIIVDEIWEKYGTEKTVLIYNMAGFTRLTKDRGIVYFLGLIRLFQKCVEKIVPENDGQIIKFEADNGFVTFDVPEDALRAAIQSLEILSIEEGISFSAGIESGRILVAGHDFFGDAVNVASKLGEDIAGHDEIIIGPNAWNQMIVKPNYFPKAAKISNVEITGYSNIE